MSRPQSNRRGRSRTLLRAVPLVIMTACALLVTACGGGSDTGGEADVKTVVVWDRAGSQADVKKAYFDTWNKNQGAKLGIKVNYEPQAADKYEEIVRVAFQTNRGPDIFHTPSSQMGGFVGAGWVQPLDGIVDQSVLDKAKPYLGPESELVWQGKPYAIPTTLAVNRLVINTELFKKAGLDPADPPATFSELVADSKKIAAYKKGKTYGMALRTQWVGFRQWDVDLMVMAGEPDLTNGLFNRATGKYEMTRYADVITTLRQMEADKSIYPGTSTMDDETALSAFANGETGMMLNSGGIVPALQQLKSKVKITTAPLPIADDSTLQRIPLNAGFPYGISAKTEDTKAAGTVLEALVSDDVQKTLAEGNISPLSPDVWNSSLMKQNEELQKFRPTDQDQQWPKNPNAVVPIEGKDVDQTIVGLVTTPSLPIESTLKDLQDRYNRAYSAAVKNGEIDPAEFTN